MCIRDRSITISFQAPFFHPYFFGGFSFFLVEKYEQRSTRNCTSSTFFSWRHGIWKFCNSNNVKCKSKMYARKQYYTCLLYTSPGFRILPMLPLGPFTCTRQTRRPGAHAGNADCFCITRLERTPGARARSAGLACTCKPVSYTHLFNIRIQSHQVISNKSMSLGL